MVCENEIRPLFVLGARRVKDGSVSVLTRGQTGRTPLLSDTDPLYRASSVPHRFAGNMKCRLDVHIAHHYKVNV